MWAFHVSLNAFFLTLAARYLYIRRLPSNSETDFEEGYMWLSKRESNANIGIATVILSKRFCFRQYQVSTRYWTSGNKHGAVLSLFQQPVKMYILWPQLEPESRLNGCGVNAWITKFLRLDFNKLCTHRRHVMQRPFLANFCMAKSVPFQAESSCVNISTDQNWQANHWLWWGQLIESVEQTGLERSIGRLWQKRQNWQQPTLWHAGCLVGINQDSGQNLDH